MDKGKKTKRRGRTGALSHGTGKDGEQEASSLSDEHQKSERRASSSRANRWNFEGKREEERCKRASAKGREDEENRCLGGRESSRNRNTSKGASGDDRASEEDDFASPERIGEPGPSEVRNAGSDEPGSDGRPYFGDRHSALHERARKKREKREVSTEDEKVHERNAKHLSVTSERKRVGDLGAVPRERNPITNKREPSHPGEAHRSSSTNHDATP
jgi:hypothetical protein